MSNYTATIGSNTIPKMPDIYPKEWNGKTVEIEPVTCMFDNLPEFNAYGGKIIYMLSCPCPKCSVRC